MARVSELTRRLSADTAFKAGYDQAQFHLRVGTVLRGLREEKNLTQEALAKLAGLDQGDISRIENGKWGKHGISHDVLDRLLPALGLRVARSVEAVPGTPMTPAAQEAMATMTELLVA
jgi:transcriptional regulator with XRE-family HTH domain